MQVKIVSNIIAKTTNTQWVEFDLSTQSQNA